MRGFLSEDATASRSLKALRHPPPIPVDLFVGLDTLLVKKEINRRG